MPESATLPAPGLEAIVPNDNRQPRGSEIGGRLIIGLEIRQGEWLPELKGPAYRVLAFAEANGPPTNPGPLIRVREGVEIDATVHNRSDRALVVHGLYDRSGPATRLTLAPGGRAAVRFRPGPAGTYYYWASAGESLVGRDGADSQLAGALIVDPRAGAPNDRVFVIGHYQSATPGITTWAVNGRSWPDTEQLTYRTGETIQWRWINATDSRHPMHLHGQYFRVLTDGDNHRDAPRAAERPSVVVTDVLNPGRTMTMEWSPRSAGRWLYHCHIVLHVVPENRIPLPKWFDDYSTLPHDQHMSGLVIGMTIDGEPGPGAPAGSEAEPRALSLRVGERRAVRFEGVGLERPGLGYALGDAPIASPGPPLVLERGKPVAITIRNQMAHTTSVHWHGIELDSYYDGVPHFGGDSRRRTPPIEPGGSFVARFTPPRAGTFIYHAHFNDFVQLSSGLYGALVVVDPGGRLDPEVDHVFIISQGGFDETKDPVLLNGAIEAPPTVVRRGTRHRIRIIGITPVATARVRLLAGDQPVVWRALAKDGADLPSDAERPRPAELMISPGETYDFEIQPEQPGEWRLEVELDQPQKQRASARLVARP